jgi:DNA replicative helicase MCM subunit Mcm2 (Cdc46/Mcm family)
MARLSFRNEVKQHDVDEALKLMDFSIRSLRTLTGTDKSRREERRNFQEQDETTKLIQKVREIWSSAYSNKYMPINDLVRRMRKQAGVDTDLNRMT